MTSDRKNGLSTQHSYSVRRRNGSSDSISVALGLAFPVEGGGALATSLAAGFRAPRVGAYCAHVVIMTEKKNVETTKTSKIKHVCTDIYYTCI